MDEVVLKEQGVFLTTDASGEISARPGALGLYYQDTRFLSRLELRLDGSAAPLLDRDDHGYQATFTYGLIAESHLFDPQQTYPPNILIQRTHYIAHPPTGQPGALRERLTLTNFNREAREVTLTIILAADFVDMFKVRGFSELQMGDYDAASVPRPDLLALGYTGRDGLRRQTLCQFSPPPQEITTLTASDHGATAAYRLRLEPQQPVTLEVEITPVVGPAPDSGARPPFDTALAALAASHQAWTERECTAIETDHPAINRIIAQSLHDLRLLRQDHPTGPYISAGIPWFAVPFGRDGIIVAMQMLMVNPQVAVGTLRYLASHQGAHSDPTRDEDPGKIMHEMRSGEAVTTGAAPFGPYYGTVDGTALFLMLLGGTLEWLADPALARELEPAARAALAWLDTYGDVDGDGFIEFQRKAGGGLANQGWKDSGDSLQFPDGSYADAPIVLCEVQGYTYAGRLAGARLLRLLGDDGATAEQTAKAAALRQRFNSAFWLADEGIFAQALDGHKTPVPAATSNAGHCLWGGIADEDRAPLVAQRLLAPDMLSGWGMRTLTTRYPSYNPLSYHNGSIWPHDTSLVVAGLKAYGHDAAAADIFGQVAAAGAGYPDSRLPELYGGLTRREGERGPIPYPVSCSPQAWAAGSVFLMLQSALGLRADAALGTLTLRPVLPVGMRQVTLRRLQLGPLTLDLEITSDPTIVHVRATTPTGISIERNAPPGQDITLTLVEASAAPA